MFINTLDFFILFLLIKTALLLSQDIHKMDKKQHSQDAWAARCNMRRKTIKYLRADTSYI